MEKIKCDLCNSEDHKIIFTQTDILHKSTDEEFNMVRCENCDLCFLNPRPNQKEIEKYYVKNHREAVKLHKFLNLMSDLDMGNDMVLI